MNNACHAKINALKKVVAYLKVKLDSRVQFDEMNEESVGMKDICDAKINELQRLIAYQKGQLYSIRQKSRMTNLNRYFRV